MKFWDTSAVVALCVTEPSSAAVRPILQRDSSIVVWWATHTECISALMRQVRDGSLKLAGERQARFVLKTLTMSWTEMQPSNPLRDTAERLLAVHALRAADAFQLSAAIRWCQGEPKGAEVVSFDLRLREAASKEGFSILPEL